MEEISSKAPNALLNAAMFRSPKTPPESKREKTNFADIFKMLLENTPKPPNTARNKSELPRLKTPGTSSLMGFKSRNCKSPLEMYSKNLKSSLPLYSTQRVIPNR